jgi:hypothetical protein
VEAFRRPPHQATILPLEVAPFRAVVLHAAHQALRHPQNAKQVEQHCLKTRDSFIARQGKRLFVEQPFRPTVHLKPPRVASKVFPIPQTAANIVRKRHCRIEHELQLCDARQAKQDQLPKHQGFFHVVQVVRVVEAHFPKVVLLNFLLINFSLQRNHYPADTVHGSVRKSQLIYSMKQKTGVPALPRLFRKENGLQVSHKGLDVEHTLNSGKARRSLVFLGISTEPWHKGVGRP